METVITTPFQYAQRLCDFGPRPIGSAENRAAGSYLRAELERLGYAVESQEYTCPFWQPLSASLELAGQPLDVEPNPYTPDCDLQAATVACGTLAELEAADLEGKILVAHGALVANSIVPEYVVYAHGPDPLAGLLKAKKPAAVLAVEANPNNLFRFLEDWSFPIPSALVRHEAGRALIGAAGEPVRLKLESRRSEETTANLVTRRPGQTAERIVVCAHYDTTFNTPGAFDNASGTGVLLALAGRLAGQTLRHAVELVFFSGEDSGGVDFYPYAERTGDFEHIRAAVNIDGVGDWLGTTTITAFGGEPGYEGLARALAGERPDLVWTDPWYESDHTAFFFRGVPVLAISSKNFAPVCHRPTDTPDWLNPRKLERVTALVEELLERIDRG